MKVLITRKITPNVVNILKQFGFEIDYRTGPPLSEEDLIKAVADVDAIVAVIPDQINKKVIDAANKLKIISCYSIGYDHIDYKYALAKGIITTNTPGDITLAVAEHSIALMLGISRKISMADYFIRSGKYHYWEPLNFLGATLNKKILGIVGMGRIGKHLAKIAHNGFGMKILYTDSNKCEVDQGIESEFCNLEYVLNNSDFVSLNCLLTESTKHLIGTKELKMMKPTSYLINTSRGAVVDELALIEALKGNIIAGAGLDVFENEREINKEFYNLPNVILTPHIASATYESRIEMGQLAALNIVNFLIKKEIPKYKVE
jgi:glyoxylate reductase